MSRARVHFGRRRRRAAERNKLFQKRAFPGKLHIQRRRHRLAYVLRPRVSRSRVFNLRYRRKSTQSFVRLATPSTRRVNKRTVIFSNLAASPFAASFNRAMTSLCASPSPDIVLARRALKTTRRRCVATKTVVPGCRLHTLTRPTTTTARRRRRTRAPWLYECLTHRSRSRERRERARETARDACAEARRLKTVRRVESPRARTAPCCLSLASRPRRWWRRRTW